jgi:hypothetical protein
MPASAATAISPGDMIKFREHPIYIFIIIVNAFHQLAPSSGKRELLFTRNQFIQGLQAFVTKTIIKCFGEKFFGLIAQSNLCTRTVGDILLVTSKCFFTPGTIFLKFAHAESQISLRLQVE